MNAISHASGGAALHNALGESVDLLIAAGADVNLLDVNGLTPLQTTLRVLGGNPVALVNAGARIDIDVSNYAQEAMSIIEFALKTANRELFFAILHKRPNEFEQLLAKKGLDENNKESHVKQFYLDIVKDLFANKLSVGALAICCFNTNTRSFLESGLKEPLRSKFLATAKLFDAIEANALGEIERMSGTLAACPVNVLLTTDKQGQPLSLLNYFYAKCRTEENKAQIDVALARLRSDPAFDAMKPGVPLIQQILAAGHFDSEQTAEYKNMEYLLNQIFHPDMLALLNDVFNGSYAEDETLELNMEADSGKPEVETVTVSLGDFKRLLAAEFRNLLTRIDIHRVAITDEQKAILTSLSLLDIQPNLPQRAQSNPQNMRALEGLFLNKTGDMDDKEKLLWLMGNVQRLSSWIIIREFANLDPLAQLPSQPFVRARYVAAMAPAPSATAAQASKDTQSPANRSPLLAPDSPLHASGNTTTRNNKTADILTKPAAPGKNT